MNATETPPSSSTDRVRPWQARPTQSPVSRTAEKAASGASSGVDLTIPVRPTSSEPDDAVEHVQTLRSGRISILGEPFDVHIDDDEVLITHPRWSLMGSGATLGQAEQDLMYEAAALAEMWAEKRVEEMSDDARRLRDYALKFMGITTVE